MLMCDMAGLGCEAVASARGNSETSGSSGQREIRWCRDQLGLAAAGAGPVTINTRETGILSPELGPGRGRG